jgi:murein DD-endopeptidase MepM/ murein hydrolase activator NlpD
MPHRSRPHQYHPGDYTPHPTNVRPGRATQTIRRPAGGYLFAHAGRQLRIGPIAFWVVVGTLVIMAAWTLTTATYFAFRDDVLARLVRREADMQFGYEDRIAELRARIDRLSSRQLLDQEQYEQKLEQLLHRQATLESRATALGALPEVAATGSVKPAARAGASLPLRIAPLKPAPATGGASPASPARQSKLDPLNPAAGRTGPRGSESVDRALTRVQASLDQVDTGQRALLKLLEGGYRSRAQRMRGVLADLGVGGNRGVAPKGGSEAGLGGPFVAALPFADAGAFDRQLYKVGIARAQVEQLTRSLGSIPVRKPVAGEGEIVSGFGERIDPFLGRPAMHTGLDFRAEVGDPIQATANGIVTVAGWSGGYGKMVEIDHGNGLATRYGHLSEIDVKVGQQIKIGQLVGKVGTTGRSTGPHLHYETRIDGEPVDPLRFLNAGTRLADAL